MRPSRHSPLRVGLVLVLLTVIVIALVFRKDVPLTNNGHRFNVAFTTVVNVRAGTSVRLAGVPVGKVRDVRLASGHRQAIVELQLQDRALPLHVDATARIRPRLFLEGNYFIELHPGTPGAPLLHEGSTLPARQTSVPVQFDQVLSTFGGDTRRALSATFTGVATMLQPTAARTIPTTLGHLGPTLRDGAVVAEAIRGQDGDVTAILQSLNRTAAALNRDPKAVRGLITGLDATTRVFARRSTELDRTLVALPGTLHEATEAFTALRSALPPTRSLVTALTPPLADVPRLRRALDPWAQSAVALLGRDGGAQIARDLRAASEGVAQTVRGATALGGDLGAVAGCTRRVVVPTANAHIDDGSRSAPGSVWREALSALVALNSSTSSFDGNGNYARLASGVSDAILRSGRGELSGESGFGIGRGAAPILGSSPAWGGNAASPRYAPDSRCTSASRAPSLAGGKP